MFCLFYLLLTFSLQVADEALGHKAGDLVFIIETLPHPDFARRNDDLHMDMDISLADALVRCHFFLAALSTRIGMQKVVVCGRRCFKYLENSVPLDHSSRCCSRAVGVGHLLVERGKQCFFS